MTLPYQIELTTIIAADWRALTDDDKYKWNIMAIDDQKRYHDERKLYIELHPEAEQFLPKTKKQKKKPTPPSSK